MGNRGHQIVTFHRQSAQLSSHKLGVFRWRKGRVTTPHDSCWVADPCCCGQHFHSIGAAGASHNSPRAQTCTFQDPDLQKHHQNTTRSVNRTPSHVTFSRVSQHTFQCRTSHWLKVSCAHVIHVSSACCCCPDTLRPSTLHSSPSLSSSFSFS